MECKREHKRRQRAANPEKHRERERRYYAANPQPVKDRARAWDKAHAEVTAERKRAWRQANLEASRKSSREGQRRRRAEDPEAVRAATMKWRAANPEAFRESNQRWLQRTDRPCRYAKVGCTEFSAVGQKACPEHVRADKLRYFHRKRDNLRRDLAMAQAFICPWCALPLPPDCGATEIDHIIPVTRGGPDEDWNLQLLHGPCNQAKKDKVTPAALELAAAHDVAVVI
jgi:5-methylcytosine-specific restriction endonuclease McrA